MEKRNTSKKKSKKNFVKPLGSITQSNHPTPYPSSSKIPPPLHTNSTQSHQMPILAAPTHPPNLTTGKSFQS